MGALEMDRQEARDRRESLAYALPRLDAAREALAAQIARTEKHYGTCRYTQWPASSYHAVTTLEADVQALEDAVVWLRAEVSKDVERGWTA